LSNRSAPLTTSSPAGFTLVELIVVISMIGIIASMAFTFFNTSFNQYISLQAQGSAFTDLSSQTHRIGNVLRGTTDILSASADDIDCYAYFAPADTYVSRIHYYKSADGKKFLADVTRMTANPPQGTPIASTQQTYTIIDPFHTVSGVNTFTYLDAAGNTMALPINDLRTIKGIQVTLVTTGSKLAANTNQTMSVQVSLRNRKTNL